MTELVFANEEEKRSGWTLSPSFLKEIQRKLNYEEDELTLEQIEVILLNTSNIKRYLMLNFE